MMPRATLALVALAALLAVVAGVLAAASGGVRRDCPEVSYSPPPGCPGMHGTVG